eukprot:FR743276.1.p1 GENE.FR743276.1~~FR743276.1.p1  ORF type:complete len:235 (+),score=19.47 FR743276.1:46-705(+)
MMSSGMPTPSGSETLTALFNKGLTKQRSGDHVGAQTDYELFLASADEVGVPEGTVAEVHVNLGQIRVRAGDLDGAKGHFRKALESREVSAARVNLALLAMMEGQRKARTVEKQSGMIELECLETAIRESEKALEANDGDQRSSAMAAKILADAQRALNEYTLQKLNAVEEQSGLEAEAGRFGTLPETNDGWFGGGTGGGSSGSGSAPTTMATNRGTTGR